MSGDGKENEYHHQIKRRRRRDIVTRLKLRSHALRGRGICVLYQVLNKQVPVPVPVVQVPVLVLS